MRFERLGIYSLVAVLISVTLSFGIVGCGGDQSDSQDLDGMTDSEGMTREDSSSPQSTSDVGPAPASSSTSALTVEDIERWERGIEAEIEAVAEAEESMNNATTEEETANAMIEATEQSTLEEGAEAAGVSEDRYRFIRSTLSSAVKYLTPLENEMDVSQMPESTIEQFEQSRRASLDQMSNVLPAEVVDALRPQALELREQDMALTAARLRAAGMGG